MRSDIVQVNANGTGVEEALAQAEAVAVYKKLPYNDSLKLRLLAEEMMGLLQGLMCSGEFPTFHDCIIPFSGGPDENMGCAAGSLYTVTHKLNYIISSLKKARREMSRIWRFSAKAVGCFLHSRTGCDTISP